MTDIDDCDHQNLKREHLSTTSGQIELWLVCRDCPAYITINASPMHESAHIKIEDRREMVEEVPAE